MANTKEGQTRKPQSFSLHVDVIRDFNEHCSKKQKNKSAIVEELIKEYLLLERVKEKKRILDAY